jgi:hypothetical protein
VRQDFVGLIVARAARGYVILYKYIPEIDTASALTVRCRR